QLAVVQAAGLVRPDLLAEPTPLQRRLERGVQSLAPFLRARSARMPRTAVVEADEEVLSERRRHVSLLRAGRGKRRPDRRPRPPIRRAGRPCGRAPPPRDGARARARAAAQRRRALRPDAPARPRRRAQPLPDAPRPACRTRRTPP